jgi:quercetin dioxygenase-like cupin family protein
MNKVNLDEAFSTFDEEWAPRLAGKLNGQVVKLARGAGEVVWHSHDTSDELFLVVSGELRIEFREDPPVTLQEGEFLIVPQGVEHRPVAQPDAKILLVESTATRNTGSVETEHTVETEERIE